MSEILFLIRSLLKHNPKFVWIMEGKSVMAVLGEPGDSSNYPLLRSITIVQPKGARGQTW